MKPVNMLLLLIAGLLVLPAFASEQTVCKGNISITKTHETIITRSGRTLITADIELDKKDFSCKGLDKRHTKVILDDMLKKKTSIELSIEKQYFKTGGRYAAEYIYPDDLWYVTKHLELKPISTSTLQADLPKVENKLDGILDYSKHELQLFLKALDKSKIPIGSISKEGTVQIDLPKLDIKAMHNKTGVKSASMEKIFRMKSCKDREWDTPSKYPEVYPYLYNSISIELYGLEVGLLVPASSKKVLGNNLYRESSDDYRYHNEPVSLGSEYYFYNFDKDISFKEKCVDSRNDKWADVSNVDAKKGWNFIKESLLSIDKDSNGAQVRLGVSYENAKIGDADIKWYLKPLFTSIPEEVMVLAKKMYLLTPLTKGQFMGWVSDTLGDFKLTHKKYGKLPDNGMKSHSTNNVHIMYKHKEKKIDMYVIDTAKFVEDLGNARMIYDMDASFNKEKKEKKIPYISQKRGDETKFVYIYKDRVVIHASGYNMEAEEMWQQIKKMNLKKLLP